MSHNGIVAAVIVAAGTGRRMGAQSIPKQFLPVGGMPILAHTLSQFERSATVDQIILVIRKDYRAECENLLKSFNITKVSSIAEGGRERQDSVYQGLRHTCPGTEIVLIHDAVRMFVTESMITNSIREAERYGASVVAVPAKDTIKEAAIRSVAPPPHTGSSQELFVVKTFNRNVLWQIQTPQTFQYRLIFSFHQQAIETGFQGTDDAMLAEHFGHPVKIVPGSYRNIKITTHDDLLIAEAFLQDEQPQEILHTV